MANTFPATCLCVGLLLMNVYVGVAERTDEPADIARPAVLVGPPCNGEPEEQPIVEQTRFDGSRVPRFVRNPAGGTVAIIADFDGCWDILSRPQVRSPASRSPLFTDEYGRDFSAEFDNYIAKITHGASRVVLFVGSNRQSAYVDRWLTENKAPNDGGAERSQDFFERITKEQNWELNKALVADHGIYKHHDVLTRREDVHEIHQYKNKGQELAGTGIYGSGWGNESAFQPGGGTVGGEGDYELKLLLVQNALAQLRCGPAKVYFFDDIKVYLDYVRNHLRKSPDMPKNIEFHTVHFDYMEAFNSIHLPKLKTWLKDEQIFIPGALGL